MVMFRKLRSFFPDTYSVLLPLFIMLFVFRPLRYAVDYPRIWMLCLTLILLYAVYQAPNSKTFKITAALLGLITVVVNWIAILLPTKSHEIILDFFSSAFLFLVTIAVIYDALVKARFTLEALRGVVCAYFLLGFLFGYLFTALELFVPGSFTDQGKPIVGTNLFQYFSEMLYFSMNCITTLNFGDIIPVKSLARTAVIMEAIVGQFYIAILVSRLVKVYSPDECSHTRQI